MLLLVTYIVIVVICIVIFVTNIVWTYWDIKGVSISYYVYVVLGVKKSVLKMEVGVSVYLIICIIILLYIAINALMGRKTIFNHSLVTYIWLVVTYIQLNSDTQAINLDMQSFNLTCMLLVMI